MPSKNVYNKTISIKSEKENPVPVEILANHIRDIAEAMKKIDASRVRRRVVILLLRDMCPRITITDIENILDAMTDISKKFLK